MATPRLANLRLPGSDGGPLYVDVRTGARPGEGRPTVVICHGFKGFKDWGFFPRLAERLALAGCTAVTFNFSGSGVGPASDIVDEPDRWFRQTLGNDLADLETVITHVASAAPPWIGLVGHSRGGGTAIIQAARDPRVRALVTWAAVAGFVRYTPAELERWRHDGRMEVVNSRTGQVLPIGTALLDDLDACGSGSLDVLAAAARVRVPWRRKRHPRHGGRDRGLCRVGSARRRVPLRPDEPPDGRGGGTHVRGPPPLGREYVRVESGDQGDREVPERNARLRERRFVGPGTTAARARWPGPHRSTRGRRGSESGSAKPVEFAQPVGAAPCQQGLAPPLEPEAGRGKRGNGQQTDTEDANETSWAMGMR